MNSHGNYEGFICKHSIWKDKAQSLQTIKSVVLYFTHQVNPLGITTHPHSDSLQWPPGAAKPLSQTPSTHSSCLDQALCSFNVSFKTKYTATDPWINNHAADLSSIWNACWKGTIKNTILNYFDYILILRFHLLPTATQCKRKSLLTSDLSYTISPGSVCSCHTGMAKRRFDAWFAR